MEQVQSMVMRSTPSRRLELPVQWLPARPDAAAIIANIAHPSAGQIGRVTIRCSGVYPAPVLLSGAWWTVSMAGMQFIHNLTTVSIRVNVCQFLYYGLPGAGTLAAELHQSTLSRVPIQTTVPVSKVVRDLSVLLSYFERERLPDRTDFQVCTHIGKMIGALLDDTLNRGLPDSTQQQHPHQDQELPELSGTLPHDGLESLNLATDAMASQAFLSWFDELVWDYPTADLEPDSLIEPQ